jgi:hypothetical protein
VGSFCKINQHGNFSGMNKVRIKRQMEMWLDDLIITEGEGEVQ